MKYAPNALSCTFTIIHIFGAYWVLIVLNNFNDYVCSGVSVNFYWTTKIENIRIFCHTLGHNMGTIAWSILFLPVILLKLLFGWINWLVTSNKPNGL